MALSFDQEGCCLSSFMICSGSSGTSRSVKGMLADFLVIMEVVAFRPLSFALAVPGQSCPRCELEASLQILLVVFCLGLAMPGLKGQGEPEQRRQVSDHAKRMPGSRLRAEIWMLRVAEA